MISKVIYDEQSHLGKEIFRSLRSCPFRFFLVDYGLPDPKVFRRGTVLALCLLLSRELRFRGSGPRVGVVLPCGLAGYMANFALLMSGRIPVNLNFSLGPDLNEEILKRTEVELVITASKMVDKFPGFPWPKETFFIDEFLHGASSSPWRILLTFLRAWILPDRTVKHFGVPLAGGAQTATLLFTSGSSGSPKGVPLSHANVLANCNQLHGLKLFSNQPKILANLPLFHSFGLTVGMIFPTLRGLPVATAPSPLDHNLNLKVVREQKVEILLGTPTFFRGYLLKASPDDFRSVKFLIAGAEKSPRKFRERCEGEWGCEYLEGYGLTETSPALSFNSPDGGKRCGSVGKLLARVECRTIDPETGMQTALNKGGILCFRGPNVFAGYWRDDQKTKSVFDHEGWFKTGDLGRLDEDGFLWIEGRVSRFSKIGGEMVPHERIEEEIMKALDLCPGETPKVVVCSLEDEQRGERLFVVSSLEIDLEKLRADLRAQGMPNLWMPKEVFTVGSIATLPTGKIDWAWARNLVARKSFKGTP